MESKIVTIMFITMVMVMVNFVIQAEAEASPFRNCYTSFIVNCAIEKKLPRSILCPFTCIETCLAPPPSIIPPPPSSSPPSSSPCGHCYTGCVKDCANSTKFPNNLKCPFTCIKTCLAPPPSNIPAPPPSQMILADEADHTDYFCKLGCATHHCAPLSSFRNPNVVKVSDCVDSCSDRCSNKN